MFRCEIQPELETQCSSLDFLPAVYLSGRTGPASCGHNIISPVNQQGNNQRFLWRVFCIFSDLQTWVQVPLFHETCGPGERVRYHLAVCRVAATAVLVVVKALNGSCFCCRKLKKQTEHQTQKGFISYFFLLHWRFQSETLTTVKHTVWTQAPSLLFILHLITVAVLFLTVSMIQFKQFCRDSDH